MKQTKNGNKTGYIIEQEQVACFDVDETLIIHRSEPDFIKVSTVAGAITKVNNGLEDIPFILDKRINEKFYYEPYTEHIQLLKQMRLRGKFIIVWSAGGYEWAKMVIEELDLTEYVNLIMTKPGVYVDDKDANSFMEHVYLPRK